MDLLQHLLLRGGCGCRRPGCAHHLRELGRERLVGRGLVLRGCRCVAGEIAAICLGESRFECRDVNCARDHGCVTHSVQRRRLCGQGRERATDGCKTLSGSCWKRELLRWKLDQLDFERTAVQGEWLGRVEAKRRSVRLVWCVVLWCGVVWCGVVWCIVGWGGEEWSGVEWSGVW